MTFLSQKLKDHIEIAIKRYENLFVEEEIPDDRVKDIINIKKILNRRFYEYHEQMKAIKNYFKKMNTGWFIFQTGNSTLQEYIQEEINIFKNLYIKKIIGLGEEKSTSETEINKTSFQGNSFFLPAEYMSIQQNEGVLIDGTQDEEKSNEEVQEEIDDKSVRVESAFFTFVR